MNQRRTPERFPIKSECMSTASVSQFSALPNEILEEILKLLVHSLQKHEIYNKYGYFPTLFYINDFPTFKDFLVLCQLNSRIRHHIRSSVYLNTLLLSWSAQRNNEMIPLWVSKSPSENVCGLLTKVILINKYYRQLPFVEASNIANLFKQCRNLKNVKIRECANFSLPDLMLLLHEDQEIVCTLDMLELNPPHSIKGGWGEDINRDGSKAWAQAMTYFKQIFQARNWDFYLNPEVCPCGKGILRRHHRWFEYTDILCSRCNKSLPECCGACYEDSGFQHCHCTHDCCHDFACEKCSKDYACQECGKFYSSADSSQCREEGCDSLVCEDCGLGRCDNCWEMYHCPDHDDPYSMCDNCCAKYCSECEGDHIVSCEKCGIEFCTEHASCLEEHECEDRASDNGSA